jgi:hypothetical protein
VEANGRFRPLADVAALLPTRCRNGEPRMDDQLLSRTIMAALGELEKDDELIIISTTIERVADRIAEAVLGVVPNTGLSAQDLYGIRSLIFHAVHDKQFFDWEMPTLTGFNSDEFIQILGKLPRE